MVRKRLVIASVILLGLLALNARTLIDLTSQVKNILPTANLPFTYTGNTSELATATGTFTSGNCTETDANHNLVDAGAPCGGSGGVTSLNSLTGALNVTSTGGTITVSPSGSSIDVSLPNSGVTAGSYTSSNITVDAQGRVTAASNGSSGSGGAWTLISSQVLGSAAATVTFSSIPGTYNHLKLIINGRTSDVASVVEIQGQFNGDTGGNHYDYHQWRQINSTTGGSVLLSTKMGFGDLVAASADADTAGSIEVLIPNYAGTTFYKHFISHFSTTPVFNNGGAWVIGTYGGQWRSTAAITSILLFDGSGGNFVTGSSFYLYGIT